MFLHHVLGELLQMPLDDPLDLVPLELLQWMDIIGIDRHPRLGEVLLGEIRHRV